MSKSYREQREREFKRDNARVLVIFGIQVSSLRYKRLRTDNIFNCEKLNAIFEKSGFKRKEIAWRIELPFYFIF